jgi:hypothetical protein
MVQKASEKSHPKAVRELKRMQRKSAAVELITTAQTGRRTLHAVFTGAMQTHQESPTDTAIAP